MWMKWHQEWEQNDEMLIDKLKSKRLNILDWMQKLFDNENTENQCDETSQDIGSSHCVKVARAGQNEKKEDIQIKAT